MWLKATEKESDMSQHDFNIANQGFPAFRSDLNDALLAVRSTNSGTTAPSPTVAGMLWYDATNNILKRRNTANSAWIDVNADTVAATTVRGNSSGSPAAETSLSMATLRTMLGFSQTLATAQVQVLPGGAMIQSGTGGTGTTGVTITFPTAFSASVKIVFAPQIPVGGDARILTAESISTSSVFVRGWSYANVQLNVSFNWIAMGY